MVDVVSNEGWVGLGISAVLGGLQWVWGLTIGKLDQRVETLEGVAEAYKENKLEIERRFVTKEDYMREHENLRQDIKTGFIEQSKLIRTAMRINGIPTQDD